MRRTREDGFALIAVLVVMLLLMAISGAMHTSVISETYLRGGHARATAGFYAAEAGINRGMGDYRNIFLAYRQPEEADNDFDEKTLTIGPRTVRYQLEPAAFPPGVTSWPVIERVPAGQPFAGLNSQLYSYVAQATSEVHAGDVEVSLGTQFDVNYIPLFQFLAFYENDLEINPGPVMNLNGPIHSNGSIYFNSNATLTIADAPPNIPTVSITARNNVFRGRKDTQNTPRCGGTVTIDTLADTASPSGDLDPRNMNCASSSSATSQSDSALAPWLGAIKARQPYVAVPSPDVLTRGVGQYWELADLRIALDLENPQGGYYPIVVLDADDNVDAARTDALSAFMEHRPGVLFYNDVPNSDEDDPSQSCGEDTYCDYRSYPNHFANDGDVYACPWSDINLFHDGVTPCAPSMTRINMSGGRFTYRRGGFFNNRENRWVYMLNVNLRDLLAWNRATAGHPLIDDPDDETEGGLVIYLTVKGPNSTGSLSNYTRYGVRVFGSPNLNFPPAVDPTGVTVVSDQAIYVEGHYNVNVGQPLYNAAYPKQPAAFMGDTINVLSSAWSGHPTASSWTSNGGQSGCRNDCQSRRSLNDGGSWTRARPAFNTYINAAFLGGVDTTDPSASNGYNGGFENYPRFHEKWNQISGVGLTYRGSFVSLGTPRRANGRWCGTAGSLNGGCNIYDAPGRFWNYDSDFQTVANLPPITPRVVSVQQVLFTENFR